MTESATVERIRDGIGRRKRAERRFRAYGIAAVTLALVFLGAMLVTIVSRGLDAFERTEIALDVTLDSQTIDPDGAGAPADLMRADYQGLIKRALRAAFPEARSRREKRELYALVSVGAAFDLRDAVRTDPGLVGRTLTVWLPASDDIDMAVKGEASRDTPPEQRRLSDRQLAWLATLEAEGRVERRFNTRFFTAADSREPELAGILGAATGSLLMLAVCLGLSFPLGVLTAVYLQEFAPRNRLTDLIEVNVNNLAAVPSIVFGLLGLAVFLGEFGLPRSAPLVGGMVLALMTLPTIIIAGRAALEAVPGSIREAALALGASPVQAVFHHVLPSAMPGMLTGTIIGMAQALGETAPLLMIGMVAFITDVPGGFLEPATALPVQIYLWADSPERAFGEKTAAAIMVLLAFLIAMNLVAIVLRRRFERC
ncbi:MAG: phosphate ABC transporter permease PstA [Alphaproteobacteria bacterium]